MKSGRCSLYFYEGGRLSSIKHRIQTRTILRGRGVPFAEQHTDATGGIGLLATDNKGSVLQVTGTKENESHTYTVYGHNPKLPSIRTLLAFNGEPYDQLSTGTLLGNGYRLYSPTLMRFNSSDSLSPFGAGGVNPYCYCLGDPINHVDPTGHDSFLVFVKAVIKFRQLRKRPLPHTGTNDQMFMLNNPSRRSRGLTAVVAPQERPDTNSPAGIQAAQTDVTSGRGEVSPQMPQVLATSDMRGHRNRNSASLSRGHSSDSPSASDWSRDTTPDSSRSTSPSPDQAMPDFVQTAMSLRSSAYYSRRFEN